MGRRIVTLDEFLDAWSIAASRSFGVRNDGAATATPVIVPYADFANHHPAACDLAEAAARTVRGAPEMSRHATGDRFTVVALQDYAPGDEVFVCYHRSSSNAQLALNWGFTLPTNPRDYVRVATVMAPVGTLVDAPEASALHARRQKLLRTVGLPTACFPSRRAPQISKNCTLAIAVSRVPLDILAPSLARACGADTSSAQLLFPDACDRDVLWTMSRELAETHVPPTETRAAVIGQLLGVERHLLTATEEEADVDALRAGGAGAARQRQRARDAVQMLRMRHGLLNLTRTVMRRQVLDFAGVSEQFVPAQGAEVSEENVDVDTLLEVLRLRTWESTSNNAKREGKKKGKEDTTTAFDSASAVMLHRHWDAASGQYYVVNTLTGQRWWDPMRWTAEHDAATGRWYFYSPVTGHSVWELPPPAPLPPAAHLPPPQQQQRRWSAPASRPRKRPEARQPGSMVATSLERAVFDAVNRRAAAGVISGKLDPRTLYSSISSRVVEEMMSRIQPDTYKHRKQHEQYG